MATKKESVRNRKQRKEEPVKWESTHDDAFYLKRSLANVQNKINRMGELIPRLALDASDLTPEKLLARMKASKKEFQRRVSRAEKKTKKTHWPGAMRIPYPFDIWKRPWDERPFDFGKPGKLQPCSYPSGMSYWRWLTEYAYDVSWINHDSTMLYSVDSQYWESHATILFGAELDDDAAMLRDDNPDWAEWGSEVGFRIPNIKCRGAITVSLWIRLVTSFTNAADDGGTCFHSVAFAHTDPSGHFQGVYVPSVQEILKDFNGTGNYDSGWLKYSMTFDVLAGTRPRVAVLFVTHLSAQDGTVTAVGQWNHLNAYYQYLEYRPVS